MTQILVTKHDQDQPVFLAGLEAKNPVPASQIPSWEEFRGLAWIFYEDDSI